MPASLHLLFSHRGDVEINAFKKKKKTLYSTLLGIVESLLASTIHTFLHEVHRSGSVWIKVVKKGSESKTDS